MPSETFSEADAAALLGRAADLHAQARTGGAGRLSLDDLKEAAAAAGIDPVYVEAAARLPTQRPSPPGRVLGIPTGVERTRIVDGHLGEEAWRSAIGDLRETLGGAGHDRSSGDVRIWARSPLRVTVESTGEVTRLVARADWSREVKALLGVSLAMAVLAAAMKAAAFVNSDGPYGTLAWLYVLLAAGVVLPVWPHYRAKHARVGAKFEAALDRVARLVDLAGPASALRVTPAGEALETPPRLLDLDPDPVPDAPAASPGADGLSARRERRRA